MLKSSHVSVREARRPEETTGDPRRSQASSPTPSGTNDLEINKYIIFLYFLTQKFREKTHPGVENFLSHQA